MLYMYWTHLVLDAPGTGRTWYWTHLVLDASGTGRIWYWTHLAIRTQQDLSKFSCSCCCPPLLSCSFLVLLGFPSHYPSTFMVVFLCFLFPPLIRIALLLVVYCPSSSLCCASLRQF